MYHNPSIATGQGCGLDGGAFADNEEPSGRTERTLGVYVLSLRAMILRQTATI